MSFSVADIRRQFPILSQIIDGKPVHYLDNGASAQTPDAVLDAVRTYETTGRANVLRGVHRLAERATEAYENARIEVAQFLGVEPMEVVFTGGCTAAINLVAYSWGSLLKPGDRILLSELEHHSNIVPWQLLRRRRGGMSVALLLAINAAVLIAVFVLFWLVTLKTRDVTPIDSVWALGMVVLGWTSFVQTPGDPTRKALLMALCTVWGLRLGLYLLWRWRHHGPDRRYQTMFAKAKEAKGWDFNQASVRLVYAIQVPLLFIVCLPVQLGQVDAAPTVGMIGKVGAAIAVIGILFESIGDWQLVAFRRDPANAGKVLTTGLWRYTRHPNYFGDACVWWGLYLIAAESMTGLWALPGPILLTYTLMRWSGVPTVEGRMKRKKPDYEAYVRRTSGFVPWLPKSEG